MGAVNDLKKQVYGEFIAWLEVQKLGDMFSNDIWASKLFDRLFQVFQQSKQSVDMKNQLINSLQDDELKAILSDREKAREEAVRKLEEMKSNDGKPQMKLKE